MGEIKGVAFGDIHTSTFGAYLSSVTIGQAAIKENKIDIPGASGALDLTDFFGSTLYENRTITFEFTFPQRNKELLSSYSSFQKSLHGKQFDSIVLDDDKSFRYVGRVSVGELKKGALSKVKVQCDCSPFKYGITPNNLIISVTDVEYPTSYLYGDVNGDGVIDNRDLVAVKAMIGKKTFESDSALRADFNFNGVVSEADRDVLDAYLKTSMSSTFKNYTLANAAFFDTLRNCKRQTIDFGSAPAKVKFTRLETTDHTRLWDLRIDNISQFGLRGFKDFSVILSGVHEVMISTANTNTTGDFSVTWNSAGTF